MVIVYVLESALNQKRYVGITNDLPRRLVEHRSGNTKAGHLLGKNFTVVYTEEVSDHAEARRREKFLKSGAGRKWLKERRQASGPA